MIRVATDTIAAVATPPGTGGVGMIRISGPAVPRIAEGISGALPRPRHATLAAFRDTNGEMLDRGILLYFPAPSSFTGEDVLELQGHGGPIILDLLLARCLHLGARVARPGEFSERAFRNGKLDLAQAEAIADLIEGATERAVRLAARSLQGVFSDRIKELIERLTLMRTHIEATLDFPDDELGPAADRVILRDLGDLIERTRDVLASARQGQAIRDGLTVVIAGPPNAGKSSLLNALSGEDAAIVTPIPGTTRDLVKLDIQVDGLPVRVIDTAGLRHTPDPIEREGVRRSLAQLDQADLVLWVYDANEGADQQLIAESVPHAVRVTRVRNKIDLRGLPPGIVEIATGPEVALSAKTGAGLDLLRSHLKARAGLEETTEGAFVARRRHLEALRVALGHLESAEACLASALGAELVAEDLKRAQNALGEITGRVTSEDLLGRIFSTFCLGK